MISNLLYLSGTYEDDDTLLLSVESYICLFLFKFSDLRLKICLMDFDDTYSCYLNRTVLNNVKTLILNKQQTISENFTCMLPAVINKEEKTYIAGLCAVLRYVIKIHNLEFENHYSAELLGFRGGCLVACSESSIWTNFCELQMPNSVRDVSSKNKYKAELSEIPESLVLLENHLKRPVRTHNILKRKLDIVKKVKQGASNIVNVTNEKNSTKVLCDEDVEFTLNDSSYSKSTEIAEKLKNITITEKDEDFTLEHCYLEGIDMTLADLIVFPCVKLLLNMVPQCLNALHHAKKWYNRMCMHKMIQKAAEKCDITINLIKGIEIENGKDCISIPNIDQISLYKRDPSHTKVKCKHRNPDKILLLLSESNIHPKYSTSYCSTLDWSSLPSMLHPQSGDLPQKRLDRKCQQIESIVTAVLKVARKNQTVVEFCAGGGHVGLLLAYFLPTCKVVLVENKESSMMRAKVRAENLKLTNVEFYQCNLDYFKSKFDVGVSLHACGVATDLVIEQCTRNKASFICCPCCYGNIQDTYHLKYPLSNKFKSTDISKADYTLLAHFADRNEINTPTAQKGEVCMGLIDMDRVYYAQEQGYKTELTTLQPLSCSPKHNLLVGISPLWNTL